ncbi:MAG TPA: hypothetical protein VK941_06760, partial [Gillisia sp.]|nr:hypothetical protein [Gillisia sp.]
MPVQTSYPGVYIEEIPSGVRTITGVSTSITAFIGNAKKGPVDDPKTIFSFSDYERIFGGLWNLSTMSFAVRDFFQNGGGEAIIVRVTNGGTNAVAEVTDEISLEASSAGEWGNKISFWIDHATKPELDENGDPVADEDKKLFNLFVIEEEGQRESFLNLSTDENSPNFATNIVKERSSLVRISDLSARPDPITEENMITFEDGTNG